MLWYLNSEGRDGVFHTFSRRALSRLVFLDVIRTRTVQTSLRSCALIKDDQIDAVKENILEEKQEEDTIEKNCSGNCRKDKSDAQSGSFVNFLYYVVPNETKHTLRISFDTHSVLKLFLSPTGCCSQCASVAGVKVWGDAPSQTTVRVSSFPRGCFYSHSTCASSGITHKVLGGETWAKQWGTENLR